MENQPLAILLVEDDEEDALLIREWLDEAHAAKFTVAWVRTSAAALQTVQEQHYDVTLVDYRLGPENGVDLIQRLVSDGCVAPIILLTGVGSYVIDAQAIKAGAADYLPKAQLGTDALERSILHALAHKRTQIAIQERIQLASLNADVNAALVQGGRMQEMHKSSSTTTTKDKPETLNDTESKSSTVESKRNSSTIIESDSSAGDGKEKSEVEVKKTETHSSEATTP